MPSEPEEEPPNYPEKLAREQARHIEEVLSRIKQAAEEAKRAAEKIKRQSSVR